MNGPSATPVAIRRIRLIGFHNFVDETIEIPDGGHLFLLGDNGSGKTTVLDAIHLVLTGALDVELNAAVRFGVKREPGRSLAGVVLRHDAERGVVHRTGATAYVALELGCPDEGPSGAAAVITIGVGLEATTMDAQVTKWGFVRRGSLETLDLTVRAPGGVRARTREELRGSLGKNDVFLKMTEYRRALAERLFGGETAYEEVCRFWAMAKSYREIVSGARDFAGLFERLLPGPDEAVLGDIFDSLRRLEELDASIRALEEQRGYVAGVAELVRAIAAHRTEIARHRWLGLEWQKRELGERGAATSEAIQRASREAEAADAEALASSARREEAERAVRTVENADVTVALARVRDGEREQRELERVAAAWRTEEAARARRQAEERERHGRSADELFTRWSEAAEAARRAIEDASRLPTLLPRAMEAAEADHRRARERGAILLPELPEPAQAELAAALAEARRACREAEAMRELRARESASAQNDLEAMGSHLSAAPDEARVKGPRTALERAGIEAAPLYELLEPRPEAPPEALAVLEALLGNTVLGTLVTSEENVERSRALLAEHRGSRLAVRVPGDVRLPAWVDALFAAPSTPRQVRARAVLAAALSQPGSFGELVPPDALSTIELRGVALVGATRPAELLGERARREAHAVRTREVLARVSACEARTRSAVEGARVAAEALARVERADASVRGLRVSSLFEAQRIAEGRERDLAHAEERLREASLARAKAEERREEHVQVLVALRARAAGEGVDELELRLDGLRRALREATTAAERASERRVRSTGELAQLERLAMEIQAASEALDSKLALAEEEHRRASVRSGADADTALGPGGPGDRGGFESLRSLERALDLATKNEHARCEELVGDGSRGVRAIAHAGRFGFVLDRHELRVVDRRGVSVENVLAELDLAIGESREVVSQRTRELLDTLVMGALARELQGQVERLHETIVDLNRLLSGLEFGASQYRFRVVPRPERAELVTLVRRMSVLDPQSRAELRTYLDERRAELARGDGGGSELLDYRRWFDYRLVVKRTEATAVSVSAPGEGETETVLTRDVRALGSGGEQGVPNYLLVLALAKLGYDAASARACPLLFDEAFYGIDAARRDTLLRFATDLGLQLVVASPDQDGVTPAVRSATTLFVVKDDDGDVHLAPYHFVSTPSRGSRGQLTLLPAPTETALTP